MKKIFALLLVAVCLLCSACDLWMSGEYYRVTPHQDNSAPQVQDTIRIDNYEGVKNAIRSQIEAGNQSIVISSADVSRNGLMNFAGRAYEELRKEHPITAYAVKEISLESGTSGGQSAVAVKVTYLHDRSQILRIKRVKDMDTAYQLLGSAVRQFDSEAVLLVEDFELQDPAPRLRKFVEENPQSCMEMPKISTTIYPQEGVSRIMEVKFTYEHSREQLQMMQEYVSPIFAAAALYVRSEDSQEQKFSRLYSFLMETTEYRIQTSTTPAYSLLHDSMGDSRAFANVYGVMCRTAGLDCVTVSGTFKGQDHSWNRICQDGVYYYVDLLGSLRAGELQRMTPEDMADYSWEEAA